jgi:hypothetical protein
VEEHEANRIWICSPDAFSKQTELDGGAKEPFDAMQTTRDNQCSVGPATRFNRHIDGQFFTITAMRADRILEQLQAYGCRCFSEAIPSSLIVLGKDCVCVQSGFLSMMLLAHPPTAFSNNPLAAQLSRSGGNGGAVASSPGRPPGSAGEAVPV